MKNVTCKIDVKPKKPKKDKNRSLIPDAIDISQATAEANRCLLCYDPPCSKACPAGTDPGAFIRKLKMKNMTGAIRTIKKNNILGGACGILCPTNRLCEQECSACGIDKPIQIGKLQRFLVEQSWKTKNDVHKEFLESKLKPDQRRKVAVIGSGPAGLACAASVARAGHSVTVFEAKKLPGGVLRYGVPSFRLPDEFLDRELLEIKDLGVKFNCSKPIKGKDEAQKLLKKGYSAVFIGCGLWEASRLETPARPREVFSSIKFLEDYRTKNSSKNLKGKRVGIIGGGSVAIDCARVALAMGAEEVSIIYRRSYLQMPAEPDERLEALNEGIHFLLLNQPVDYDIDKKDTFKGVRLVRTRLGKADASGRRTPEEVKNSEWTLEVDMVVEAIGNITGADTSLWLSSIETDRSNRVKINDDTCETSVKGIFAGGDITRGPALVVEAIRDGKAAARSILESIARGEI